MINRKIKDYEIKELIATGGMAAIYKATDTLTGRTLAIKILHGHLAQDRDFITRFERAARAAASLKHENIIDIIGYGEAAGLYYIAMEYIDGKSLKDVINSVKYLPHDIALAIVYEICQGIEHAHQKGVVHRDIKPANILVSKDGQVKITDFGLAQAQDLTSITVTGAIVGTPAYMSPEQAAGRKIDTRSDIFSLGVVIYEMVTGTKPFQGESYSAVIHAILTVPAPRPIEANPIVVERISGVIEKMLQKDADNRYQNITRISEDVYDFFKDNNIEVTAKKIGEFILDPNRISSNKIRETKEKHLKRGLYYMTLGKSSIDDAISEFEKVRYLDPEDANTRTHLSKLKRQKKAGMPAPKKPVDMPPKKKRFSRKVAALLTGALATMAIAAILIRNSGDRTPNTDFGSVYVDSDPGQASIFLNSNDLKLTTPAWIDSITGGDHALEVRKNGYQPYAQSIRVEQGETIRVNARLVKEMPSRLTGSIAISSRPAGARVLIDGIDTQMQTPCTIEQVTVGQHSIELKKNGYETVKLEQDVRTGQTTRASADLTKTRPKGQKRAVQNAYFKINVDPWAKIYIDGKYYETTPIARPLEVQAGAHSVRLENPNFQVWQKNINFKPGQTVSMDIKLEPFAGHLRISVRPWADVYIDGKFYETTPIADPIPLPAGRHTLKLINPSYLPYEEVFTIVANQTLRKSIELVRK
jgi:serine/threonine protein kinase